MEDGESVRMTKCQTMGCSDDSIPDHNRCALCTVGIETEMGRAGFSAHGRQPSQFFSAAIEILDARMRERMVAAGRSVQSDKG